MSHNYRYVKQNFGCHCFYNDSAFKRYNRAHSGGDTLIFNYYGNSCGGYMPSTCGCGFFGGLKGFWGGLGAGLGMGLMNFGMGLLGGWMNNLMGGFGGCGFGGWMGNMFGGFGGTPAAGVNANGSGTGNGDKNITNKRTLSTGELIDNKSGSTGSAEGADGTKGAAGTQGDNGVQGAAGTKGAGDEDIPEDIDKELYNKCKEAGLDNNLTIILIQNGIKENDINTIKDLGLKSGEGKAILSDVPDEKLSGLNADVSKVLLKITGYISGDEGNEVGKMSNDYKVLLLLQNSGVTVNVAHNSKATADEGMIRGQIKNVKKDSVTGEISYDVHNEVVEGDYNLTYSFSGYSDGLTLTQIVNNTNTDRKVVDNWAKRVYEFKAEGEPLEIDDDPLVSTRGTKALKSKDKITE